MNKHLTYLFVVLTAICLPTLCKSQDVRFSQFYHAPFTVNPAQTGNFKGITRFSGIVRQQWASVADPYTSTNLSADGKPFHRLNKLAIGLSFLYDRAGDAPLTQLKIELSAAYRFKLTTDSLHSISIGLQSGIQRRQLNTSNLVFQQSQDNGRSLENINATQNNVGVHTGIQYEFYRTTRLNADVGIGLFNLTQPKRNFLDQTDENLNIRHTFHLNLSYPIVGYWDIIPGMLYSSQGPHQEFLLGSNIRYWLNTKSWVNKSVSFGAWNRFNDAIKLFLGVNWKNWQGGISYDINYSNLNESSNYRGAWEISLIYIINSKKPVRRFFKSCPDFI